MKQPNHRALHILTEFGCSEPFVGKPVTLGVAGAAL